MLQNTLDPSAQPRRLRGLLAGPGCLAAPETPDGLLGRMVALAGFETAFVGLLGSALNRLGSPDEGLLTGTELVDNATRAIGASGLPTVVDIGSGFGNPINVRRTVSELVRGGAAAVLLRDAEDPRRHRTSTAPIPAADMAAKLRAARDAAGDTGLVLVAGLEGASSATSMAECARRAAAYREAGADLVHVGTLRTRAQARALAAELQGAPLACSLGPDSEPDTADLAQLGFRLAFFPHCGLLAAVPAIEHTFAELARTGTVGHIRPHIADFRQFTDIAGLPQVQQLEQRYGVPDEQRTTL
jgi:2-methylisocitrate lyase-like PEP mutase family enzyme